MSERYIVNRDGFLVDTTTGEVIDDLTYRFVQDNFHDENPYEIIAIKKLESIAKPRPKPDIKKYLSSLLPEKLREEFLSRVDKINKDAEVFAHFILFCREYGIAFDFEQLRKDLNLSKISLRTVRKKMMLQGWFKPWERVDPIFFQISEEIDKKYWLPAILLAIDYISRGLKITIDEIKKHLSVNIDINSIKNHYLKYLIRNDKYSMGSLYPRFICFHGKIARIYHDKKYKRFEVFHFDKTRCFNVSEKKVMRILSKMEIHYEVVKNSS